MRFAIFSIINPEVPIELCEWSQKRGWTVSGMAEIMGQNGGNAIAVDELINYAEDRV